MLRWNKFFKKGLIFISPFLFFISSLYGQNECRYSIEGAILNDFDKTPLIDARIEIEGLNRNTSSDDLGYFSFSALCSGTYVLVISHFNCDSQKQIITVPTQKNLIFSLSHRINVLEEIIVADQYNNQSKSSIQTGLTENDLSEKQTEDLATALADLAGVNVLQTGSNLTKPIIHGMSGARVGIIVDGARLQDQEWGSDHAPTLDINAADRIEVVKGSGALRYGGDTPGGVIILQNASKFFQDTLSFKLGSSYQSNGRGGGIVAKGLGANGKGKYIEFNTTLQQMGDQQAPNYLLTNTGQQEQAFSLSMGKKDKSKGWQASYRWYQTRVGILRSAHVGNVGDLARAIRLTQPLIILPFSYKIGAPRQESQHHNGKVQYFHRLSDQTKWEINYNIQRNHRKEYDVRRGDDLARPAIDLQLWTHDLEGYILHQPIENFKFSAALSGKLQDNYSDPNTGVKRLIPDYQRQQIGFFSNMNYMPNSWFNLDLGLRFDQVFYQTKKYYDRQDWIDRGYDEDFTDASITTFGNQWLAALELDFFNFSSSLGMRANLSANDAILVNLQNSQRPPNPSELFSDGLHHALATIEYGNLRLNKETVHKFLLGWERLTDKLYFETSLFYSHLKNYIINEPIGFKQSVRGAFPVWQYRAVSGYFWGWDAALRYQITNILSYRWSSSAIYAQDTTRNQPLIDIPPFNVIQEIRWESKQKKGWYFSLKNRYTAQQKRFPDNNFDFTLLESGELVATPIDISSPPASFSLWDVNAQIRLYQSPKSYWDFRLGVKNMTNISYRNYLNRLRFYSDETGRNIEFQINYSF